MLVTKLHTTGPGPVLQSGFESACYASAGLRSLTKRPGKEGSAEPLLLPCALTWFPAATPLSGFRTLTLVWFPVRGQHLSCPDLDPLGHTSRPEADTSALGVALELSKAVGSCASLPACCLRLSVYSSRFQAVRLAPHEALN